MPATRIVLSGAPARSDFMMEALGSIVFSAAIRARRASCSALREGRGGDAARSRSSRASRVARASPTSPSVSLWLRPISCSSASIWTMRVPGLKDTVASRLPTASTTSASWMWARSGDSRQNAAPSESGF